MGAPAGVGGVMLATGWSEVEEQMIADWHAGFKITEIAARAGVHPSTAGKILRRRGIDTMSRARRQTPVSPEQRAEIVRYRRAGVGPKAIANLVGLSRWTVRRVITEEEA